MEMKTLMGISGECLCNTFNEAFSDYAVPMTLTKEMLFGMLNSRSFRPEYSYGMFAGEKLVGLVCVGLREIKGEKIFYICSSGVIPAERRKGLVTRLFRAAIETAREERAEKIVLEVIKTNIAAVNAYLALGFSKERELLCLQGETEKLHSHSVEGKVSSRVREVPLSEYSQVWEQFWDFVPTWQNTITTALNFGNGAKLLIAEHEGKVIGYGIVNKENGALLQLAVAKDCRMRGIGKDILVKMADSVSAKALRAINVEVGAGESMELFLRRMGFAESVGQYEMSLKL